MRHLIAALVTAPTVIALGACARPSAAPAVPMTASSQQALKTAFADAFLIGAALNAAQFAGT